MKMGEQYADVLIADEDFEEFRENAADASGEAHRIAESAGWSTETWVANAAANAAYGVCGHMQNWLTDSRLFETPFWAARAAAGPEVVHVLTDHSQHQVFSDEEAIQCQLLRDIFGPMPPKVFEFGQSIVIWNNGLVKNLAQTVYDDRAFGRLPLLADALQKAGCSDADVLDHCLGCGPHTRGCWVLDSILDKH